MTTEQARFEIRRDSAAGWLAVNPVLLAGEPGFEEDTGKHKIGDGATAWSALPYFIDETALSATYAAATGVYQLASFTDNGPLKLMIGDGANFKMLQVQTPPTHSGVDLRDPSLEKISGTWWLCATTPPAGNSAGVETSFGVWSSADGENYTYITAVDCSGVTGANRVWAPDWFVDTDGSVHVVVGISTDGGGTMSIYETHPTNAAMTTWATPTQIFTNATNAQDPFLIEDGGNYHLFYVEWANGYVQVATATGATLPISGYTNVQTGDWAGFGTFAEGPCIVVKPDGGYRIFVDKYQSGAGLSYADSTALLSGWGSLTPVHQPLPNAHHCSVVRLDPADVIVRLAAANQDRSSTFVGAKVYLSAAVAHATQTNLLIPWDSEEWDSHGFHDNVTNESRFTVPEGCAGKYAVTGVVKYANAFAGSTALEVQLNGSSARAGRFEYQNGGANDFPTMNVAGVLSLAVGDYVELLAYQDSAASRNVDSAGSFFEMHRIG